MSIRASRQELFIKPAPASPVRQRLWQQMRQDISFSISGLARTARSATATARNYVKLLVTAEYVTRHSRSGYELWRDSGLLAPTSTRDGEFLFDPNNDRFIPVFPERDPFPGPVPAFDSLEGKCWLALRILRTTTPGELATATECVYQKVERWLRSLSRFGVVRRMGESAGEPLYRLVLLPGPKAPSMNLRLGQLYDHNTNEFMALER